MKTFITLFLILITSVLFAEESQNEIWDCYFVSKNNNQMHWIWDHSDPKIPKKENVSLTKFSFKIQKEKMRENTPPQLLWKKEVVQVVSDFFSQEANAYLFSVRSDSGSGVPNAEDAYHFFDIENPLKIYSAQGSGFRKVIRKKENRFQLMTIMYGDSARLTTYNPPLLKPKIEKDFNLWRDYGMFAYMNLDSSYRFRFAAVGLNNMASNLFIPPELLLKNNISDTNFFLQYQDQNFAILIPVKDRPEQLIFCYHKLLKRWDVYKINMKRPDGYIIGKKYIIYDLYDIEGYELTNHIHVIDLVSGEIRHLCLPLNTKIIAIQGDLWILTMPGQLMFLRKTGETFHKVGTILREDAENITYAWIKKVSREAPATK